MTIKTLLNSIKIRFKESNIETYSLDAQLILCHVLNLDKIKLITNDSLVIDDNNLLTIESMVIRRLNNEPMQYILGKCEFMGLMFYVNEGTLIPRSDTEILVEEAINIIKKNNYKSAIDIGTGSGAIAISLNKYTNIAMTAVDISTKALEVAKKNAVANDANVEFINSDLFHNVNNKYDIIVSNPPYIEKNIIPTLMPQVKDFEPLLALDGGEDGLDFYKIIINDAINYINAKGCIIFEIGYNQGLAVSNILKDNGYTNISVIKDLAGLDRVVVGYKG